MANRTVLITGAAQRIGAALARDLHSRGMDIIIHYHHSVKQAQALAEELNTARRRSACSLQADLQDEHAPGQLIRSAMEFNQRLDALINNASNFFPTVVGETTIDQWRALVDVNMKAPYFLASAAAIHLRPRHGTIINMTDIHAERPLHGYAVYSAAKAGLAMLTKALAAELGPEIRVNAVAPGAILWPEDMPEDQKARIIAKTPLEQKGATTDIASAVYYLIDEAVYMTGQVLTVDGGRTLRM